MRTKVIEDEERQRTCYQVHRDEYCTQRSHLREDIIDLVVRICHLDRNLRQVVGVRPRQNFFVMIQIVRHGYQVVLIIQCD
jgi:hypothetical protein